MNILIVFISSRIWPVHLALRLVLFTTSNSVTLSNSENSVVHQLERENRALARHQRKQFRLCELILLSDDLLIKQIPDEYVCSIKLMIDVSVNAANSPNKQA